MEKSQLGVSHRYLGVLRSAISMFSHPPTGRTVGSDPRISDLMKGLWRANPPRVRYTATWSVDTILDFYSRDNISNSDLNLKDLTIKLALLLAINLIARAGDLNCLLAENYIEHEHKLELLLDKPQKQQRSGILAPLSIYAQGDVNICPVAATLNYIYRTRLFRQQDVSNRKLLFLSLDKRHVNVTNQTISRWILSGMQRTGIDTTTFKAHSIRGATASSLRKSGLSLKRIISRGRWKNGSVFKKHYLRPL